MMKSIDGNRQHHNSQQQRLFRLFQALREDNLDFASRLIEEGAPLDLPLILKEEDGAVPRADQFGFEEVPSLKSVTALGYAAGRGAEDHVHWLLSQMASISAPFSGGRDAAWLAMEMGQIGIMSMLLEKGVRVDLRIRPSHGPSRLIAATQLSNYDAVDVLVHSKARISAYDEKGRTALHYNFSKDPYTDIDYQIGQLLIDWGGIPGAMDKDGITVSDLAHCEPQHALLRAHGITKRLDEVEEEMAQKKLLEDEPEFDPKDIVRPAADDPGIPQLNKVPVFKKPRF